MKVWILFNRYNDTIEGVYTEAGRAQMDDELLIEARQRLAAANEKLALEIAELKDMRKPYITEAEILLDTEAAAKEANNTNTLKNVRKQRKVLLKQAERLTFDIKRREEKILASQRMLKEEVLHNYGRPYYWEEFYINGE
jgi:uncharacterized protein HemY